MSPIVINTNDYRREDVAVLLQAKLFTLNTQWTNGQITPQEFVKKASDHVQQALRDLPSEGVLASVESALADPLSHELTFNVMGWQVRNIDSSFSTCVQPVTAAVIASEIERVRR